MYLARFGVIVSSRSELDLFSLSSVPDKGVITRLLASWLSLNPQLVEQQNWTYLRLILLKLRGLFFEAFWNTCRRELFCTRGRRVQNAMDGGAGDAITLGELAEALSLSSIPQDPDAIEVEWFAANVTAFELRAAHAGAHPLNNQIAFEFRDGADNHHDRPTQWAAGIDLFAETYELDIDTIQLIEHFQEVFD